MLQIDFTKDLPEETRCECCQKLIPALDWGIGRCGPSEWMGICVVKCVKCNWVKIAAAGSDEQAHKQASYLRLKLIVQMGL